MSDQPSVSPAPAWAPVLVPVLRRLAGAAEREEDVASVLADSAVRVLGVTGCAVASLEGDRLHVDGGAGLLEALRGCELPLDPSIARRAVETRAAVSARRGDGAVLLDPRLDAQLEVQSMLVVPMEAGGRPVGALIAIKSEPDPFSSEDVALASQLADLGSLAARNARLLARERSSAREARALVDIVRHLNQSLELERVVNLIAEYAADLLGGRGATVMMLEGERLRFAGTAGHARGRFKGSLPSGSLFSGEAIRTRAPARTPDLTADPRWSSSASLLEGIPANAVVAPLLVGDRAIGAVLVYGNPRRDFGPRDEELLLGLASHAALAVENARLYRAAAQTARHAEILAAAGRTLASYVSRGAVFEGIGGVAAQWLGVEGIIVYAVDTSRTQASVSHATGVAAALRSSSMASLWSGLTGEAIHEKAERVIADVRLLPDESLSPELRVLRDRGIRAIAAIPLLADAEVRGLLVLAWETLRSFDLAERELLGDFGALVAMALENARLFEGERRARGVAEAFVAIARSALSSASPSDIAREILRIVDGVAPSGGKALALTLDGGSTLTYLAASGVLTPLAGLGVPSRESAVALVQGADGRGGGVRSQLSMDAATRSGLREGALVPDGAVALPLVARDRTIGVLWTCAPADAPVGDPGAEVAEVATHVALAVDVVLLADEERKRRERERMLATALATMDQPVFVLGLDRRIWYANTAAMREYRYTQEALTEIAFDRLVSSAVPARRLPGALAAATSSVWMAEHVHRRRDGTQFPASVTISYIRDDGNVPVGQVVTVRNLTDERRIEEQLRQSEKLAALGELVAGVAHELNNPLAGISAFAQLMLEEELSEEQRDSVRLIKRESDRAVGVIRDLLIFSRKAGPSRAPVEINDILELTLRLRAYSLRSAGVTVEAELERDLPPVRGDDQRLQQVFLNLIVNAEYALQRVAEKRLTVRTKVAEEGLVVTIADSGIGMSEETRLRVFEPFFTTKPAGQGTGLGLSVSYGIVQAHGGSIAVDSELGKGTEFRIFLPAADSARSVSPLAS